MAQVSKSDICSTPELCKPQADILHPELNSTMWWHTFFGFPYSLVCVASQLSPVPLL